MHSQNQMAQLSAVKQSIEALTNQVEFCCSAFVVMKMQFFVNVLFATLAHWTNHLRFPTWKLFCKECRLRVAITSSVSSQTLAVLCSTTSIVNWYFIVIVVIILKRFSRCLHNSLLLCSHCSFKDEVSANQSRQSPDAPPNSFLLWTVAICAIGTFVLQVSRFFF